MEERNTSDKGIYGFGFHEALGRELALGLRVQDCTFGGRSLAGWHLLLLAFRCDVKWSSLQPRRACNN